MTSDPLAIYPITTEKTCKTLDMLLAKKRAADRKAWLEAKGNLAEV